MDVVTWLHDRLNYLAREYGTRLVKPTVYVPVSVYATIIAERAADRRWQTNIPGYEEVLQLCHGSWLVVITPLPDLDFVRIDLGPA